MMTLALFLSLHAAPVRHDLVAIVVYQGTGREPDRAKKLVDALATSLRQRGFTPLATTEADKLQRPATMCGEDTECLATIGQRSKVDFVLAVGLASAGKQLIVSAKLVATTGRAGGPGEYLKRWPLTGANFSLIADEAAQALLTGVEVSVVEVAETNADAVKVPRVDLVPPPPAPVPPLPELVVAAAPARPVRTAAVVTGVAAIAVALAAGALTVVAQQHYQGLAAQSADRRPAEDAAQRSLNLAADLTWGTAITAGVATGVLLLVDRQ